LIAIPNVCRDLDQRQLGLQEKRLGSLDSLLQEILVWCLARCLLEQPMKVLRADTRGRSELFEVQGLIDVTVDEVDHPPKLVRVRDRGPRSLLDARPTAVMWESWRLVCHLTRRHDLLYIQAQKEVFMVLCGEFSAELLWTGACQWQRR